MKRIPFKKGSHLKKFVDNSGEIAFRKKHYHNHLKIALRRRKAKEIIAKKIRNSKISMRNKARKSGII